MGLFSFRCVCCCFVVIGCFFYFLYGKGGSKQWKGKIWEMWVGLRSSIYLVSIYPWNWCKLTTVRNCNSKKGKEWLKIKDGKLNSGLGLDCDFWRYWEKGLWKNSNNNKNNNNNKNGCDLGLKLFASFICHWQTVKLNIRLCIHAVWSADKSIKSYFIDKPTV